MLPSAARLEITGTQLAGHQIRRRSTEADAFLEQQGTTQILASVFSVFSGIGKMLSEGLCFQAQQNYGVIIQITKTIQISLMTPHHLSQSDPKTSISPPGSVDVQGR